MLKVLVGAWLGSTLLSFTAEGTYFIGGTSFFDLPLHGGHWSIQGESIEFIPYPVKRDHKIEETLFPRGPFRCGYTLRAAELILSDCPYQGSYVAYKSRRTKTLH